MDSLKSLKELVLSQKCSIHNYMHCDFLLIKKAATKHRVCLICIKENNISQEEVISIAQVLKVEDKSAFPIEIEDHAQKAIFNKKSSLQEMLKEVDNYFDGLLQKMISLMQQSLAQETKKVKDLIQNWEKQDTTLDEFLSVEELQKLLLDQSPNTCANLHSYIFTSLEQAPQQFQKIRKEREDIGQILKKFNLNQPLLIQEKLLEMAKQIDFYLGNEQSIPPSHFSIKSTKANQQENQIPSILKSHIPIQEQVVSNQKLIPTLSSQVNQDKQILPIINSNQIQTQQSIIGTDIFINSQKNENGKQLVVLSASNFILLQSIDDGMKQVYSSKAMKNNTNYIIKILYEQPTYNKPNFMMGLVKSSDKDSKFIWDSSGSYIIFSTLIRNYVSNFTKNIIKGEVLDTINSIYGQKRFELRFNISNKYWRVGSIPYYSNVVELSNRDWINPEEEYHFCIYLENSGETITIEEMVEVISFDNQFD